jgi:hypothetical protein
LTEIYEKWGFGLAPPKKAVALKRREAAERVLQFLEQTPPFNDVPPMEALSEIKGLFNRVARQDQWDWFTVSGELGYPSDRISQVISECLSKLRSALRDNDASAITEYRSTLLRLPTRKCLGLFLGKTVLAEEPNSGWIYILSTRETPDLLKIGKTTRTVEERAREISGKTGVPIPYGVRSCWRVKNPSLAEKIIHDELTEFRIRGDREFFRINFFEAKRRITDALENASLEIRTLDNLTALSG